MGDSFRLDVMDASVELSGRLSAIKAIHRAKDCCSPGYCNVMLSLAFALARAVVTADDPVEQTGRSSNGNRSDEQANDELPDPPDALSRTLHEQTLLSTGGMNPSSEISNGSVFAKIGANTVRRLTGWSMA